MILGALVVGLLTAYYFGRKPGTVAAAAAMGLFLLAATWPDLKFPLYLVVGAFVAGVCFIGPKRGRSLDVENDMRRLGKTLAGKLWRRL